MKRLSLLIALFVGFTLALNTSCGVKKEIITDHEQEVNVKRGQKFIIKLNSNPTTGYEWQIVEIDPELKFVKSEYFAKSQDDKMMGSGGYEHWYFKARKKGKHEIKLRYDRPQGKSADPVVYVIRVK